MVCLVVQGPWFPPLKPTVEPQTTQSVSVPLPSLRGSLPRLRPGDERPAGPPAVRHPERGGVLLVSDRLHGARGEWTYHYIICIYIVIQGI